MVSSFREFTHGSSKNWIYPPPVPGMPAPMQPMQPMGGAPARNPFAPMPPMPLAGMPPSPRPPMAQQSMPQMQQQGSNAPRRRRFGDSLEGMLSRNQGLGSMAAQEASITDATSDDAATAHGCARNAYDENTNSASYGDGWRG